jgi:hypothetical protein
MNLEHIVKLHSSMSDVEHRKKYVQFSEFPSQPSPNFSTGFFIIWRHRKEIPVNVEAHRLGQVTTQIEWREVIKVLSDVMNRHHVQGIRRSSHFQVNTFHLFQQTFLKEKKPKKMKFTNWNDFYSVYGRCFRGQLFFCCDYVGFK